MSYDVSLCYGQEEVFWRNYTSNVSCMWREAGCNLRDFDTRPASELLAHLIVAIGIMERDPAKFKAMDAPNGWGDYDGCLEFLRAIRDACSDNLAATVEVSS